MKKGQLNPANIKRLKQFLEGYKNSKVYDTEYLLAKFAIQHGFTMEKVKAYYDQLKAGGGGA